MFEQFVSANEIIGTVSHNIDMIASLIDGYMSGANHLRIASIILIILAFILFLFLIIIIYVKSIISFLRSDGKKEAPDSSAEDDIFNEEDERRLNEIMEEQEREKELEKELQRELDMARAEKEVFEKKKKENQKAKKEQAQKEKKASADEKEKAKAPLVELDWEKGKLKELENQPAPVEPKVLSYRQSLKEMPELLGLIIDMLGRGVDDLKIAQTVMFKNQGLSSEDDILQTIDAVKDFIGLCLNQSFQKIDSPNPLPSEEEALLHLAHGDTTLVLALLENLMDYNIDRSAAAGAQKDALYAEISRQACIFGTLSAINDIHLATGAFELSIELTPHNVLAWSRLGDMYWRASSVNKAVWAYQNVLNFADDEINIRQVANAGKRLSEHFYSQGNSLQAAKLYNSSKQYYDSLGINRRLDRQEMEIIRIIEANHQNEIQSTVQKLLGKTNAMA